MSLWISKCRHHLRFAASSLPEVFHESEVATREANHELAIDLAEKVICISDAVRRDIQQSYDVSGSKVETIWPIPNSHFWMDLPEGVSGKIRAKFKLDDDYLFLSQLFLAAQESRDLDRCLRHCSVNGFRI